MIASVAITRAEQGADRLAHRLRAEGFEVRECPLVKIERIPGDPIEASEYDWIVLTSRVAVDEFFRRAQGVAPRIAVIGPGTADALREHGLEPALIPERSTQEGLLEILPRPAGRVLFAGAEGARELLVKELTADVVWLYRTIEIRPHRFPEADLVVLASASAARSYAALDLGYPCVSIGPVTSAAARDCGLRVVAEAATHDLDGLVGAVKLAASSTGSSPS